MLSLFTHGMSIVIVPAIVLSACSEAAIYGPLPNSQNRAIVLSFGLYVTPDPAKNPIDPPERFEGFHTATDFEVSQGELAGDVPVYAICPGKVVYSGFAEGYGGLLIHTCTLNDMPVTVLYGHLRLEGMPAEGETVYAGQTIALLAPANSYESGYNRKHLHLGIHKGSQLDFRGYVQEQTELESYIDPLTILLPLLIDLPGQSPGETPYWQKNVE